MKREYKIVSFNHITFLSKIYFLIQISLPLSLSLSFCVCLCVCAFVCVCLCVCVCVLPLTVWALNGHIIFNNTIIFPCQYQYINCLTNYPKFSGLNKHFIVFHYFVVEEFHRVQVVILSFCVALVDLGREMIHSPLDI